MKASVDVKLNETEITTLLRKGGDSLQQASRKVTDLAHDKLFNYTCSWF